MPRYEVADPVKSLLLSFLRLALVWTLVSDLARFIILLFALVVASEARRRMSGVEGWGRHLRCGPRVAVQETLRAHPPVEPGEFRRLIIMRTTGYAAMGPVLGESLARAG